MTTRLKASEISGVRNTILLEQNNLCALCLQPCDSTQAVLDHDHKTGHIRGVLHRGCNAMEGIITNNMARNLVTIERLAQIFTQWQAYHAEQYPMLHPSFRTVEEKKQRAKKRAAAKRKLKN